MLSPLARVALAAMLAVSNCGALPPVRRAAVIQPLPLAVTATAPPAAAPPARPAAPPFLGWVASHCFVDRLAPAHYTVEWQHQRHVGGKVEEGALLPLDDGHAVPAPGTLAAERRLVELERELAEPRSHVVDCRLEVRARRCPQCPDRQALNTAYIAYLPEALFREPERVRSVLLLVPGGRGGRSRWFLSPIPGRSTYDGGSGGLRTRQIVDAYLAEHPDASPPIVVALESTGAELDGSFEHLTRDMPRHVAETYLGRSPSDVVFGAEGASSGARALLEALWQRPDAFATVGLSSMACGRVDPDNPDGMPRAELERWAGDLAARHARGELAVHFRIGARDPLLPCSRSLYRLLAGQGIFAADPPRLVGCAPGASGRARCDLERDGWTEYAGGSHNYAVLAKSHRPQLEWHLAALDAAVRARLSRPTAR